MACLGEDVLLNAFVLFEVLTGFPKANDGGKKSQRAIPKSHNCFSRDLKEELDSLEHFVSPNPDKGIANGYDAMLVPARLRSKERGENRRDVALNLKLLS